MTPEAFAAWRVGVAVPRTTWWRCWGCFRNFAPFVACRALRVRGHLEAYCPTCVERVVAEAKKGGG